MRLRTALATLLLLAVAALARSTKAPLAASAEDPARVYGEWRIRVKPDQGAAYGRLIQEKGLPLFREAGGKMVGWWTTLIGDLYEQVTIWEFDGMPAFEKAVGFLGKDERFLKFAGQRDPLLSGEESRFLRLARFAERPALPLAAKLVIHEVHRVPLGRMEAYLKLMEEMLPVLRKHGFQAVGPLETAVGRWNEVTYLFSFESLAERERMIASFGSTAEGKRYGGELAKLADAVTTRLLVPAAFAR